MAEYDGAVALVQRLIEKKGRAGVGVYRVGTGTASNAARPWKLDGGSAADVLLATVRAVFLSPVEARGDQGQFAFPVFSRGGSSDDSVLSDVTYMVYVAAAEMPADFDPETAAGLLLVSGTRRYVVLRAQALTPADQTILYVFSVKG